MKNGWVIYIVAFLFLLAGCKNTTNNETAKTLALWAINEISITNYDINLVDRNSDYEAIFIWSTDQPERIDFLNNTLIPIEEDIVITLTVSVTYKGETEIESTVIIIDGLESTSLNSIDDIAEDFISQFSLIIGRDYDINTDYTELGGTSITWETSHPQYFSNDGKYNAPFINTNITINYTVETTVPEITKSFEKEFTVYRMSNSEREEYIVNYLKENLTDNNILESSDELPVTIGIEGVSLVWSDANEVNIRTLDDVTTYIIPNVGVDLTIEVITPDYPLEIKTCYQTVESNSSSFMREISSVELIKEIKVGWNLGNTFDSPSEGGWGNPKTTKAMIDAVKAEGFNLIRLPVTWEGHFLDKGEFIIDENWLNRIQEVINYAIDGKTFVILNMHHERWNSTSFKNKGRASLIMEKLWTQIATRFKNYDEHLIFEGMNEPRIYEASASIQWGGNAESFEVINHLNQVFVNTVRSLGGNNQYRHLMITGVGGGTSEAILSNLVVPDDQNVIVSVHAYTPYDFAHDKTTVTKWSKSNLNQTNAIDSVFNRINEKFINNNIAVIMGEFASRDKANIQSRLEWLEYYLKKAGSIGVPCTWWDTGQEQTPENMTFSIFDRRTKTWLFPEIVATLMNFTN